MPITTAHDAVHPLRTDSSLATLRSADLRATAHLVYPVVPASLLAGLVLIGSRTHPAPGPLVGEVNAVATLLSALLIYTLALSTACTYSATRARRAVDTSLAWTPFVVGALAVISGIIMHTAAALSATLSGSLNGLAIIGISIAMIGWFCARLSLKHAESTPSSALGS